MPTTSTTITATAAAACATAFAAGCAGSAAFAAAPAPPVAAPTAGGGATAAGRGEGMPAAPGAAMQGFGVGFGLAFGAAAAAGVLAARRPVTGSCALRAERQIIVRRAFESELGVQAPVGFFDPLGLSKDGDADAFRRRRVTEIKHGRISMLACLGYIVPEYFHWPGYCSTSEKLAFTDIPNGLAALEKVPGAGWVQMFLFGGIIEKGLYVYDPSRAPGDFENGGVLGVPNGSTLPDGETKTKKLNAELANGRLAMMAIMGMMFQDGLTGSAWGSWDLYTDSPLRSSADDARGTSSKVARGARGGRGAGGGGFDPSAQIGATAPLGFWDPCGFTARGGEENFLELRGAELKHGRVAMLAIIGFLGQPSWRFPGFEGVPDGVGALTSAPGSTGFACLFLLVGFFELRVLADLEEGNEPGNFGDPFKMIKTQSGGYDDYWRNFELNNGRLAMIGAIGTITANWYTGLDAYQQWQAAKPATISFIKTTLWFAP